MLPRSQFNREIAVQTFSPVELPLKIPSSRAKRRLSLPVYRRQQPPVIGDDLHPNLPQPLRRQCALWIKSLIRHRTVLLEDRTVLGQ